MKDTAPCPKEIKTPTITVAAQTNNANIVKGFDIPQQKQETGKLKKKCVHIKCMIIFSSVKV